MTKIMLKLPHGDRRSSGMLYQPLMILTHESWSWSVVMFLTASAAVIDCWL